MYTTKTVGFIYLGIEMAMIKIQVDDPLNAVAVHLGGGVWGIIAVAFFNFERGIFFRWNRQSGLDLAWQIISLLAIIAWTGILSTIMFASLKFAKVLRVHPEIELQGTVILLVEVICNVIYYVKRN